MAFIHQAELAGGTVASSANKMHMILACLLFAGVAFARPEEGTGQYTTKYDNIDLKEIMANDRLYQKYFQCLIGKGPCTPDGKELKEIIPDALKSKCSKCNEKQKQGVELVLKHLIEKKKADFEVLEKIYDPQGTYLKSYKEEAEKRGIKLD